MTKAIYIFLKEAFFYNLFLEGLGWEEEGVWKE